MTGDEAAADEQKTHVERVEHSFLMRFAPDISHVGETARSRLFNQES